MATFLFFFTFIEGMLCCDWKEHRKKKLANRISNQIWYKGCLKGKFGRGSKSAKGPNPLWQAHPKSTWLVRDCPSEFCLRSDLEQKPYLRPPYTHNVQFFSYLAHVPTYSSLEILMPTIFWKKLSNRRPFSKLSQIGERIRPLWGSWGAVSARSKRQAG